MEMNNVVKYTIIGCALLVCISLKIYFGTNPVVADVDTAIESVVKMESGYDITPIVDAV
jgi:hypothetical protein